MTTAGSAQPKQRAPVLIVDDDELMARAMRRVLARAGFSVETTTDSATTTALVRAVHPVVLLLDLRMPRPGGTGILEELQYATYRPRVLIVSAETPERLRAARAAGADDVLEKPFLNSVLVEKVRRLAAASA